MIRLGDAFFRLIKFFFAETDLCLVFSFRLTLLRVVASKSVKPQTIRSPFIE